MSFAVGQRVICIDDSRPNNRNGVEWGTMQVFGTPLTLGAIFTIRGYEISPRGKPNVTLVENEIRLAGWAKECWWGASRFRAVDDLTTSEAACESNRIPQLAQG